MKKIVQIAVLLVINLLIVGMEYASANPDTTIQVKAIPGMQYDVVRLQVRPGSEVRLVLSNTDDMSHNLVITSPGSRIKVVEAGAALAEKGPEMDFIPDIPEVKWSIPVVAPGEEKSVVFSAPEEETVLPFVCTYPGHGYIMYGAIYVTDSELPPLHSDPNVPEFRREAKTIGGVAMDHGEMKHHPYDLEPPYYYRIFMPDASPASIAIRLSEDLSCCWDAGPCELLYAWEGGFVDNSVAWKGHRNTESKILGDIFYRNSKGSILRFGSAEHQPRFVEFKGYQMEEGFPVFLYELDGVAIREKISVGEGGGEIVREFKIENPDSDIWIPQDPMLMVSTGKKEGDFIRIPPKSAGKFSIIIQKNNRQ